MSWLDLGKGANSMFLRRLGMKVTAMSEWASGRACCLGSWMVIGSSSARPEIGYSFQATGYHCRRLWVGVCTLVLEEFGPGEGWAFLGPQPSAGVRSRNRRSRSALARTGPGGVRSVAEVSICREKK